MTQDATPQPEIPLPTREEIDAAADDVRAASDELGITIDAIEGHLERRQIEVPAWVKVKGWEDPDGEYWKRELGYDRVRNSWHIAIREVHGHTEWPENTTTYVWSFNSAPRKSRISASDKLPELLRELIKEAERTARRLREKTVEVNAFAATLKITARKQKK